jgi:hypothetical protein
MHQLQLLTMLAFCLCKQMLRKNPIATGVAAHGLQIIMNATAAAHFKDKRQSAQH